MKFIDVQVVAFESPNGAFKLGRPDIERPRLPELVGSCKLLSVLTVCFAEALVGVGSGPGSRTSKANVSVETKEAYQAQVCSGDHPLGESGKYSPRDTTRGRRYQWRQDIERR